MLAISTMPASVAASSSAWASSGCSITTAGERFCLPSLQLTPASCQHRSPIVSSPARFP
jgi:hypothetical protein